MAILAPLPVEVDGPSEIGDSPMQWSSIRSLGPNSKPSSAALQQCGALLLHGLPVQLRLKRSGLSVYEDVDEVATVVSVACRKGCIRSVVYGGCKFIDKTREAKLVPVASVSARTLVDELGEYLPEESLANVPIGSKPAALSRSSQLCSISNCSS